MKIEKLISINNYTLAVFCLSDYRYRLCIIDSERFVFDFTDIFYTKEAAELRGKTAIWFVSNH